MSTGHGHAQRLGHLSRRLDFSVHHTEVGDAVMKCAEGLIEYLFELLASDINNNGDTVHKIDTLRKKAAFLHMSHKIVKSLGCDPY